MTTNCKTSFGLLRHSLTEWNLSKRIQGQSDSPVTSDGITMAACWGHILAKNTWSRILSSDLGRAHKTAIIINKSLEIPISLDSRLRELNWGKWTGKTVGQIENEFPEIWAEQLLAGWGFCPPEGESFLKLWERGIAVLAEASKAWPGENILVVTHEGMIKCLIYHESTLSDSFDKNQGLLPYHLHKMSFWKDRLRIEKPNFINLNINHDLMNS